ncbi:MAG: glycine--tRNA ligase [Candidatus Micrarchaeota archaeon]|nr:glycine--tRNA ligase [Candidatus Micrarchaeota archaeon]
MELYQRIFEICLQRGFFCPSAEIYGSLAGFYDYGPIGFRIVEKMKQLWREKFVIQPGFVEIKTSLILPKKVLEASGHVKNFSDPVVFCKKEKKAFRADQLLANYGEFHHFANLEELKEKFKKLKILCPDCKSELSEPTTFNLMFGTTAGAIDPAEVYLRPETAQGIFLNFKRVFLQAGSKLPLAIAQAGPSFRNEVSPRKGLIRLREFEQMELEYFFNPKKPEFEGFEKFASKKIIFKLNNQEKQELSLKQALEKKLVPNQIFSTFLLWQQELFLSWGIDQKKLWFKIIPKQELPHYSLCNVDAEVSTSYGEIELSGTSYRTDFDLSSHQNYSKENLEVLDEETKTKFIPHVIEPSIGLDRSFYTVLEHCYREKSKTKDWEWFAFPPAIAPYSAAVFPLMKKDGLDSLAKEVYLLLKQNKIDCYYSDVGSIGKRYARADEIGVPYCLTIDYDSLEKNDLTLRFRDDGKQIRLAINVLASKILELKEKGLTSLEQ